MRILCSLSSTGWGRQTCDKKKLGRRLVKSMRENYVHDMLEDRAQSKGEGKAWADLPFCFSKLLEPARVEGAVSSELSLPQARLS
jgi:hypothetical protein